MSADEVAVAVDSNGPIEHKRCPGIGGGRLWKAPAIVNSMPSDGLRSRQHERVLVLIGVRDSSCHSDALGITAAV